MANIDTPISISLADHLTSEEREQILQTVEMFEVITQANPEDYQSLEILKEAYWKLGRQQDGLAVTRRLADAYMRLGQYSSAMLEYEGILQQEPNAHEVQQILNDLEAKLHQGKATVVQKGAPIALDFGIPDTGPIETPVATAAPARSRLAPSTPVRMPAAAMEPNLIATGSTTGARYAAQKRQARETSLDNDGLEPLAKFLLQHRLANHDVVNAAVAKVRKYNAALTDGQGLAASLLEEICLAGVDSETLLCGIIDRTKAAYIPLECYDVDRQVVRMLPEHLTLGRLIVPFDIVSRTMMVAAANPFDIAARNAVQQAVDYHVQWHLAMPGVIRKILREVYKIADQP